MIRLDGILKRHGGAPVLGPLSLDVAERTTVAVVGPSGSGKSTLLRVVIGLAAPDTGTVFVAGSPMNPGTAPGLRRRMGYVIQQGGLFPHLTAFDNATLMARQLGWAARRVRERFEELAARARVPSELTTRFPSELSGGEQQRVALVRALFLDPDVLLLDEPLGALDVLVRAELQDELATLFRELHKTVLLVTHDLAEAARMSEDIVLMRRGLIVQRGPIEALATRPVDAFVARFVGAQRSLRLGDAGGA